ncbi:MAG TPA: hypothetical protein VGB77_20015 [Abditibacteriaceae bacterium]
MRTRNWILLGAALLFGAPVITTLPGCGGGGSGSGVQLFSDLRLDLGNGQRGLLDLAVNGTTLTGRLDVSNQAANPLNKVLKAENPASNQPKALNFQLPPGAYILSGTFNPPRGFVANGTYQNSSGQNVDFTITGQIPTTSDEGSFTFTALGQSVSGTIPRIGQNTPTPTATATPVTNGDTIVGNITGVVNSNVVATGFNMPLKSSRVRNTVPRLFSAVYEGTDVAIRRGITFQLAPASNLATGQSFSLAGTSTNRILSYFEADNANPSGTAKSWDSISGTLRIDSIQGDRINFTITNARLQARGSDQATGSFTISATGQARVSFGTTG